MNQRDNAKDQDRKTTKAPCCGALVLSLVFQQPGAGSLFPQFIAVTDDFTLSMVTLSLVWTVFDVLVLSLYILAVTQWLPGRHHRLLERLSSLILLAIAAVGLFYNVGEMSSHYH